MSRTLILVKHSLPALEPSVPSREWCLSDVGRARCILRAERLAAYNPAIIAASAEPKATETGQMIAAHLGVPIEVVADLHENDRTDLGWLNTGKLEARIAQFFAELEWCIMGNETANAAHARFAAAVEAVCVRHPDGNMVVVAHGTVITLFVARHAEMESFHFWKRLDLPSFVALSLPDHAVQAVCAQIAPN